MYHDLSNGCLSGAFRFQFHVRLFIVYDEQFRLLDILEGKNFI